MENTPQNVESLRQHFSRRASAARIALRNLPPKAPPKPPSDKPLQP
jgi:hypothetical protein